MPNPRIQFRIPTELFEQLPSNPDERSRLLLKLLHEHYHPTSADAKLINLQSRVEQLEQRIFGTS